MTSPGYKVTAIADKKKQRGFRIEDPEGYTTDFYIDPTNGRVMSFLMYYQGYTFGTENNKFKEIEGVLVPFSFSQRFEMSQGAFFAEYSVKEVKLNQTLAEDAVCNSALTSVDPSLKNKEAALTAASFCTHVITVND